MTEIEFRDSLSAGIEELYWHWYRFHADSWRAGRREPVFDALATVAAKTEGKLSGFSKRLLQSLTASSGREREIRDYEQLMQAIAEAVVASRLVLCEAWHDGTTFELGEAGTRPEAVAGSRPRPVRVSRRSSGMSGNAYATYVPLRYR